jgi:hypothetical protein
VTVKLKPPYDTLNDPLWFKVLLVVVIAAVCVAPFFTT